MKKTIAIIGSGFSSLAAACYLAQQGNRVTIYEKNESIGGRARQFKKTVLHLIWDRAGIGCQMFLKNSSTISAKKQMIIMSLLN